jgi:hypothetical protein
MIARGKALKKEGAPIESSGMRIAPAIATFDLKTPWWHQTCAFIPCTSRG